MLHDVTSDYSNNTIIIEARRQQAVTWKMESSKRVLVLTP